MPNLSLVVSRHQQALENSRLPISIQDRIRRLFSNVNKPTQLQNTVNRSEPYFHIQESPAAVPRPIEYLQNV